MNNGKKARLSDRHESWLLLVVMPEINEMEGGFLSKTGLHGLYGSSVLPAAGVTSDFYASMNGTRLIFDP